MLLNSFGSTINSHWTIFSVSFHINFNKLRLCIVFLKVINKLNCSVFLINFMSFYSVGQQLILIKWFPFFLKALILILIIWDNLLFFLKVINRLNYSVFFINFMASHWGSLGRHLGAATGHGGSGAGWWSGLTER